MNNNQYDTPVLLFKFYLLVCLTVSEVERYVRIKFRYHGDAVHRPFSTSHNFNDVMQVITGVTPLF